MKSTDLLQWFDELATQKPTHPSNGPHLTVQATQWLTSAASAIHAAFPPGHRVIIEWNLKADPKFAKPTLSDLRGAMYEHARFESLSGVFASAHSQLKNGRVSGFVDSIRAQAEDEVLEQAVALLEANYLAAAAVLTGGALEIHLRRLCERSELTIPSGSPSIDKYNTAIAQARNAGLTLYEKPEQSLVTSWGQQRNEAAHDPSQFNVRRTPDEVRRMIDGVRGLIAKTT